MRMTSVRGVRLAIGCATLCYLTQPALGAESDEASARRVIEEIVVTAQRREQSLQDVSVAVTALSAENMKDSGIISTADLQQMVPNLEITTVNGTSQPFMRGVGSQSAIIGLEHSVATYVDGIYVASLTGSVFSFNGIERVEVLRGPQGTLFGRNATGGVVQVLTRQPDWQRDLDFSVSYGNHDTSIASLYGELPLSDSVAANLSVYNRHQGDGFGENIELGGDLNRHREFSVRGQLLSNIGERVSVRHSVDYVDQENDIGTNRNTLEGTRTIFGGPRVGGPQDGNYNLDPVAENEQWGVAQDLNIDFDWGTLRSISAYRNYRWYNEYDQDVTPVPFVDVIRDEDNRTFQQEFLLSGSADSVDWTAGAFYFNQYATIQPISVDSLPGVPIQFARFAETDLESYAIFGQASWQVGDARLTAGLRYTDEESVLNGSHIALEGHPSGEGAVLASVQDEKISADELTWHGAIDYDLTDDIMVYFSVSRGFKTGGFNMAAVTQEPTEPEILDAYEVGLKSDLFDRQLRLNLSAFHYEYDDLQVSSVAPAGILTLNAASAEIDGAELELQMLPPVGFGSLAVSTALSWLDAEYTDFENAPFFLPNPYAAPPAGLSCPTPSSASPGGNTACEFDASGRGMIRAPDWTAAVNLDYVAPVAGGEVQFTVNYSYNDGFFWEPSNRIRQDSYDVLNAQVSFRPPDSQWTIRAFGRNLTDELYYSSVSEQALGDLATVQPPRMYGVGVEFDL